MPIDLFDALAPRASSNILPYDGEVSYLAGALDIELADVYFEKLQHAIKWQHDQAMLFGKKITTKRMVAWYADKPFFYKYSGIMKTAYPWIEELSDLKTQVEALTGELYNSCLANLYHSGAEGMSWHSDAEKELKKFGAIASISLGAERKFAFKHKQSRESVSLTLEHGSLLVMKGETQRFWLHSLPQTKKVGSPRINLTYRSMNELQFSVEPQQ